MDLHLVQVIRRDVVLDLFKAPVGARGGPLYGHYPDDDRMIPQGSEELQVGGHPPRSSRQVGVRGL